MSAFNQQQRIDLAAAYRLVALFGWDDLTSTHISARMEDHDRFLLNSRHQLFEEITASSLIEVDQEGKLKSAGEAMLNQAGFVIHSAIHEARPDVGCVLHTHTQAGMAVSAMECGLLPLNQHALRFYNAISVHEYEGIALDLDERQRLVADLGNNEAMILRNHGLLTTAGSVGGAFLRMFNLEQSCKIQLDAQASGAGLTQPSEEVCEHAAQQFEKSRESRPMGWQALTRALDNEDPSYRD